jgi:hypothetical protein
MQVLPIRVRLGLKENEGLRPFFRRTRPDIAKIGREGEPDADIVD